MEYLKAQAGITAHVGSGDNARIFPDRAKQGVALPYVVYIQAGGEQYLCHTGFNSIRQTILHVYSYGSTDAVANDLAEELKSAFEALQKTTIGDPTTGQVWVDCCFVDVPDSGSEDPKDASDSHKYWRRLVVTIVWGYV